MARTPLWLEDFESVSISTLSQKYSFCETDELAIGPSYGRTGNGMRVNPAGSSGAYGRFGVAFPESSGAWVVEFALRVVDFASSASRCIVSFHSTSNSQFGLVLGSGGLSLVRATNTVNQTWLGGQPRSNIWHQMAMRYIIGTSDGECYVWMDGELIGIVASPDTDRNDGALVASVQFGSQQQVYAGSSFNGNQIYDIDDISIAMSDDFYVWPDPDWRPHTDVQLEPYTIVTLRPESDQGVAFVPSTSPGENYAMVDEADNDGDTTYNSSDTLSDQDSFNAEDIPPEYAGSEILAAQVNVVARQTYPGGRYIEPYIDGRAGASVACSVDYKTHSHIIDETADSPPVALTESHINNMTIGYKISN
jgi:hypothetical protein